VDQSLLRQPGQELHLHLQQQDIVGK
jgi:hypothetical protein